jgi:hypothetical protein
MPISEGELWSRRLSKQLPRIANLIRIWRRVSGTRCPGAFDPLSNEHDPKKDRAYHAANPSAPVCEAGIVGGGELASMVQGFHFPSLKDAELEYLSIGQLNSNQAVFLTAADQKVLDIVRYEFPRGSGVLYSVFEGFPRSVELSNYVMFWYCVSEKM